jgi:hypothetical protein
LQAEKGEVAVDEEKKAKVGFFRLIMLNKPEWGFGVMVRGKSRQLLLFIFFDAFHGYF